MQIVWKEKVRHDLARPPTIFEGKFRGMDIQTWGGPYRSVQTVKRKDVEPYKRVMPHSEYPSGSSCICQGVADYTNAFLNATGVVLPTLLAELKAGSSKVEPGSTPATDVTLSYDTIDALAEVCGSSRLDGGMHFTAAVPAGAELCAGIGAEGFKYASDLIGGEW